MRNLVFQTTGLHFSYGPKQGFQFTSEAFEIFSGETIAVMGPSGGGKSTLLRLIEGSLPLNSKRRPKTALIYQDLRLVNEKTALENTLMGALSKKGIARNQKNEKAQALLEKLLLKDFQHQTVSMLSGGQRQRVALARALMSEPDLLLADEPFSHLDVETAKTTFALLKGLQQELGFALVITLHHKDIEGFHFDHIWQVQGGKLFTAASGREFHKGAGDGLAGRLQGFGQRDGFFQAIFVVAILALTWLSYQSLPKEGFNPAQALSGQAQFFTQLFWHSPEQLAKVNWSFLLERLWLTLQMAYLGTLFGFIISCPLGFLSAEGVSPNWMRRPLRFILMCIRSVPALIWALFFVAGLGLGAQAGVAALTIYSLGYFTKLLYEGIEDLETKPFKALQFLGASRWQAAWHALIPSSKPLLISSFVFMLEYNVRSASLLGLVGAGGLGQDLLYAIEWRDFPTVFSILMLLVAVVLIFDQISRWVRNRVKRLRGI